MNHSNNRFNRPDRGIRSPRYASVPNSASARPREADEFQQKFFAGTAIDPSPRIRLEDGSKEFTMRAMDLVCPIGMGQRGLIVAPPGSGKTTFLKHICCAVAQAAPKVKLFCLLIDERPEEVTDITRNCPAEVRASSSDQAYENHVRIADELMKEAFRRAAQGEDVMIVVDSLTRLARVHNAERASSGRTLSGGVDARALEVPRRIFGAARKIENGGSLSIMATILVDTGSRMDQVIFEEFKGTGNMEVVLSRDIANQRIFPAMDIAASNTRKKELLLDPAELEATDRLRRCLLECGNKIEAARTLLEMLQKYPANKDLLASFAGK